MPSEFSRREFFAGLGMLAAANPVSRPLPFFLQPHPEILT